MDRFNDLNSASADEIVLIGDQEESQTDQSSDSSDDSSHDDSEQSDDNAEDSQQASDEQSGDTSESDANTDESTEAGDDQSESTEGEDAEGETDTKDEESKEEKPDPDEFIKEITEGKIENTAGLTGLIDENQRLKSELEKPREPEFASERAKQAYDYLQKHSGEFETLTREAHRVLSIEPEGMSDRELQFEAFALKREDLTRAEAQNVFDYKFEKLFGELEDDPDNIILKDELKVASIEAKAAISKAQDTLQSELSPKEAEGTTGESQDDKGEASNQPTPEQIEEVQNAVVKSLTGYETLQVKLGKEGKDVVNIALDKGQIESLNEAMTDPATVVDTEIAKFGNPEGKFDYDGYRDFMTKFVHHDRIVQETFNQGINVGKKLALEGAKNLETKDPPATNQGKKEESFNDAFVNAYQGGKK